MIILKQVLELQGVFLFEFLGVCPKKSIKICIMSVQICLTCDSRKVTIFGTKCSNQVLRVLKYLSAAKCVDDCV